MIKFESVNLSGGPLQIDNNGLTNGSGGEVVLKAQSYFGFKHPDITVKGAGQGFDGGVYVFSAAGKVPFNELLKNTVQ